MKKETHNDEIVSVELPAPPPWKKLWCKECSQERKKQNYIERDISFGSARQLHLSTMEVHMNLIT
ncbi:hypothetical protein RDI58_007427 [Solanum bulbocastanum]|uniref:Uncharacterized protein n=1 Tax=Solanum bulbocastanum TaxID=147425 RepID=A0AAN8YHP5_SOLBU